MLIVQVLGQTRVWRDGAEVDLGPPGRRAVFGILALGAGQSMPRRELIDALWADDPPRGAANVLQTHVKHLRQLLEPDRSARAKSLVLPSVGDGYALVADTSDLLRFRELVRDATQAETRADTRDAAAALERALGLWHGPPCNDIPLLADHPKVAGLAGERRRALARYGDAMIAIGNADEALIMLADDGARHPLDESAQARLVRAFRAAGQRGRALEVYETTRSLLAEELGVDPGPELVAARDALLRDDARAPASGAEGAVAAGAAEAMRTLPAPVAGFVARRAESDRLDQFLAQGAGIGVVCGTAGVGKTALTVHWSHRMAGDFPDGQLYLDLRGYDPEQSLTATEALGRLLSGLGLAGRDIPIAPDQRSARFRAETAHRRMLILLDNASSVEQVRPLLPGTPDSFVLVTSRDSMAGLVALQGARRLALDLLPENDALTLLRALIGERVAAEPEDATILVRQCARLPLALRIAAEMAVSRPDLSLGEIVGELADRRGRLDRLDSGGDVRAAVRIVFSWSLQHLDADAALAFRRLGLHPGLEFDAHAVLALATVDGMAGPDVRAANRLLDTLARAHLVQHHGRGRYGMHDLLSAYAVELVTQLDPDTVRQRAVADLLAYYIASASAAVRMLYPAWRGYQHAVRADTPASPLPMPRDPAEAQSWLDTERANLVALCGFAANHGYPDQAAVLADTVNRYLEGAHLSDALTVNSLALIAVRRIGNARAQAHLLTNLGDVYRLLGHYQVAMEHHRRALALHRQVGDSNGEARTLSDLGIVEERLGDLDSAAHHQRQALRLYHAADDRYGEAAARINLGNVLARPDYYDQAIAEFDHALEIFTVLGDRTGQATALANLGHSHTMLGQHTLALQRLRESLDVFRVLKHRNGEATALANIGVVQIGLGAPHDALVCLGQALDAFREIGQRYGEASVLNGLGEALRALGQHDDALANHRLALEIAAQTGDQDEQTRSQEAIASLTAPATAPAPAPTAPFPTAPAVTAPGPADLGLSRTS